MLKSHPKQLVVFDLDNTLTDTLRCWAAATSTVVREMVSTFGIERQPLIEAIRRAPTQYRFSDFGSLIDWLDQEKILPQATNQSRQYIKDMTKQYLCMIWRQKQKEFTFLYGDTVDTLKSIREHKTATALYTDSDAPSMIARMWLLARTAVAKNELADEIELVTLFDHFYCQPSIKDDYDVLKNIDPDFVHAMKHNMTLWQDRQYKPSPEHMWVIASDFRTDPAYTLMVGDTSKDGGCARPLAIDFAWCRFGANVDATTVAIAQEIASPIFQYGLKAVTACFNAHSAPSRTLRHSLAELQNQYEFAPGKPFSGMAGSEQSSLACPRIDADPADHIPVIKRVWPSSHVHKRDMPLGPATHLPPMPIKPDPANSSGTAGPERPDQPKRPQPA